MEPLLKVDNLSVRFGASVVLTGLNFKLFKGQSLGIVGESGSGKSVTALTLMGLLPSSAKIAEGKAIFHPNSEEEINLLELPQKGIESVRGKMLSMIFQEPMTSLNPSMRCGLQVQEAVSLHTALTGKTARERCISLFEEMQLPDPQKVYRSYPHQLSGGQKQRVMIAMALAGNPALLIADEPTTALDVTVQKEIILLLREIQRNRGMSLLFISHDLGVISEVTDRAIVLSKGRVVETGKTNRILTNPVEPYTKGLVACRPPIDCRPSRLMTVGDFIESNGDGNVLHTVADEGTVQLDSSPVFEVSNLKVRYIISRSLLNKPKRSFTALNSVSFNLFQGETLGVVGESGCGKTTLGRSLLGLIENPIGIVKFKGKSIGQFSTSELKSFRRQVQIVFQDPYSSLNPRLTIGEAIMEPLRVHGLVKGAQQRKAYALRLLNEVALPPDSFYRYPHEFSGGQRQRIVIARALSLEPKVLICDEMVSALDVSVQAQILNLLNDLKRQRELTYVFISHDLSVVRYMSNRIMVIQGGHIVEMGNADTIFSSPQTEYTKRLLKSIPGRSEEV